MTRDQRLWKFRLRLLGAFGIGMLPGLFASPAIGAQQDRRVECFDLGDLTTCPPIDAALNYVSEPSDESGDCVQQEVLGRAPADEGTCCYAVSTAYVCDYIDYDGNEDCGCYGRPYVVDSEVVSAPVIANAAWGPGEMPSPALERLTAEQRAALVEFWSDNARAEHSSIAGFHRFALDLFAHGAPPELLDCCIRAAADELAHARICYALASHYAGEPLGPGPMPLGDSAPIARTLVELAVATAREGCLAETSAAWLASEMASRASDPIIRQALDRIAREEAEHAELAWMTLRWAIETGGPEVRHAVAEVFADATPTRIGGAALGVPEHGLLEAREVQAIVDRGFRELLVPVMQAAMAA
jgi:hypothetical protein